MLIYSITDEMLYSTTKGFSFSTQAFSGGGRGSTAGAQRNDLAHWDTDKKAPESFDFSNRGGPIPVGFYVVKYIGNYKNFGECARLEQTITSLIQVDLKSPIGIKVTKRDKFLIHGCGPKGSDGCIVPANKEALKKLLTFIKSAANTVLLEVRNEGVRMDKLQSWTQKIA
ncbi:MAG TPA: DUF2778 domain-containing protein [Desulfuromonadales bacterium]|nr:DUF2778 domain-containing protein [Desulfuromonadales bacterium]